MADKPIGQLNEFPAGAPIDGTNTLLVAQYSNAAYKLTGQRFVNALADLLDGHGGIASIEYDEPASGSLVGTMTITMADETVTEVEINNGKGIVSVAKTGTSGYVDTYTISYNDGTTSTFTVTNGEKGDPGDAWYVHIRYAAHEPTADSDISSIPDAWIGIYSGTSSTAPTAYTAYAWYEYKGAKGDTGDNAEIESITTQYQFHTDGSIAPTGTWYNSVSAASAAVSGETQGKYLWTKVDMAFNNEQHSVFYNTAYQGIDGTGLTGVVKSINSALTPDGNGNVDIGASDVGAISAPAAPSNGAVLMYDADDGWIAGDASSLGTVKSVNSKNPDGNGNVTVGMNDISGLNTAINTKYTKPLTGIPSIDLAAGAVTEVKLAGAAVTTDKILTGAVTSAKLAFGAITREISVTIPTTGWTSMTGGGYYIDVSVTNVGISAASTVIVTPAPSFIEKWVECKLRATESLTEKIRFECETIPADELTANVLKFNVGSAT